MTVKATSHIQLTLIVIVLMAIPFFFIDSQSFWIDEGVTIDVANHASLSEMISEIWQRHTSEPQMIGYFTIIHFWTKIFGDSEMASRLSNLPWLIVFAVFWIKIGTCFTRSNQLLRLFAMSGTIQPFLVYYSVEFRPYAASIAIGAILLYAYLRSGEDRSTYRILFGLAASVAAYLQMLGAFMLIAIILFECLTHRVHLQKLLDKWWPSLRYWLPFFVAMCIFYIFTVYRGAGGIRQPASLANLAQIFYEFLGFGGLGPDRESLKTVDRYRQILSFSLNLAPLMIALAYLGMRILKNRPETADFRFDSVHGVDTKMLVKSLSIALIGIILTFISAYFVRWNIVGRHCAFYFPAFAAPLSMLACFSLVSVSLVQVRVASAVILASWVWSSVRLVLNPIYFRDDYRGVSNFIQTIKSHRAGIFLTGDQSTHRYYFSRAPSANNSNKVTIINNLDFATLNSEITSGRFDNLYIIEHRPTHYDQRGAIHEFLRSHPEFSALPSPKNFKIWHGQLNP